MAVKGFKLDQVLNFRKEVEKQHKQEFAAVKQELEGARDILEETEAAVDRLSHELREKQMAGIAAVELHMYAAYNMKKTLDLHLQRETVETLTRHVEEKREVLLGATKDKKVLEIFKEKTADAQKRELADKERAFLDEISIQKRGRGK